MNDQLIWPAPIRSLAELSAGMEWMRPLLYCLLAVAVVGLVLTLLDMALLFWKEPHAIEAKKTVKTQTLVSEVSGEYAAPMQCQSP